DLDEAAAVQADQDGEGVSRRALLGGAGTAALAVAFSGGPPPRAAAGAAPRVVIVGSGIAGLGCAYRLWAAHGIRSEVFEYNASAAGGRISTLRHFFDGGQYTEQHAEFISSEHTATRRLAARF